MIRPSIYQSVFILVVLLAFSFILVGILTPSWELVTVGNKINGASVYYRLGLGKWCLSPSDDLTECREITSMNGPSGANGAQAMFGLSLIFAGVALFWAVVDLLHCTGLSCQLWPMPIGTGVACLCAALGCIVYYAAGEYDFNDAFDAWDSKLEYSVTRHSGFSLALTYVAVLLLAAATALGMLIVRARAFVAVRLYDTFDPQGDRKSMTQEADPKLMGVWSRGLVQ